MAFEIVASLKDVLAHHRKFTQFQKVLICSIFVGVLLCIFRSWWFLFLSVTYIVTVYISVSVTRYVVTCNTYFPSDVILSVYETICDFVTSLVDQLFKSNNIRNREEDVKHNNIVRSEEKHTVRKGTSQEDEDTFYDTLGSKAIHSPGNSDLYNEKRPASFDQSEISSEIQHIICLIQRDFIESWYKLFSKEKSVLIEADILFFHIVQSLNGRLHRANTKKLFEFILLMFKDHVHFVKEARAMYKVQSKIRRRKSSVKPLITVEGVKPSPSKLNIVYKTVEECYGSKVELHLAVKSAEAEHAYQKSIIELLLVHLLREDMHDSLALVCALKEILTCNVLQKVMDLLSDTTFLHEKIINITSDEVVCASIESIPSITVSETDTSSKNVQSILTQRTVSKSVCDPKQHSVIGLSDKAELNFEEKVKETFQADSPVAKWKEDTELHTVSTGLCNECNRLCSADKDRISPRPHSCSLGRTPVFFDINVDPDRLSLQSFNSISSTSSKDSTAFTLSEKHDDVFDTQQPDPHEIHDVSLNQVEKSSTMKLDGHSPAVSTLDKEPSKSLSTIIPTDVIAEESHSSSESENKSPSSNFFPSLKIPFSNHLPAFSFKRPTLKSLSPTTEMATSSGAKSQNKNDFKRSHSQGDFTPVSDDMSWPVKRPSVFQDVRITTTEKAKEIGSFGEYTLYNVEYEALYQSDIGELVYKSGVVRRRFREFINLQSRLEDNPSYKKSMKDVKGPKKILPSLPFGNMGKDTVDSRKELLESFLNSLVGKEDICNGEELKQFLGYSGDGHIAFVRKVPENTGPRIDQRLVKTMSGVFDKIVEGLPSLPQQLPRIISPFDLREEKDELVDDKLTEDTDDMNLVYQKDIGNVISQRVESTFEKFIEQQSICHIDGDSGLDTTLGTSVLTWQDQQGTSSSHMTHIHHMTDDSSHMTQTAKSSSHFNAISHLNETDNPLSNAVLNILTEVLQRQDHWVCRENVNKAASVLIGKGLNSYRESKTEIFHQNFNWQQSEVMFDKRQRFLEEKVDFLTSTEMNIFYLKTLRETVWPDGQLSTEESRKYTDLQKEQIKQQATRCLAEFLPGILQVIVGHEEFNEALEEVMESLKYEKLNRHFWYSVFDVVLEELFPEVNTQEFQRKLSASVQFE